MITVGAGVVDEDYTGPVGAILFNHGPNNYFVNRGDHVARVILEKIVHADVHEVQNPGGTGHGNLGFGSTGF